jgi:rhamnulokinase
MDADRVIAIDLGAGSGRVVAAQIGAGRLELQEAHRFPTPRFRHAGTGYQCWDLDLIEAQVIHGLRLAEDQAPFRSVGVDAWGVDHVLLDRDRQRIGPAICYRDDRTRGVLAETFARFPAEAIYRRTGIQMLAINSLFQLVRTAQAHPDWLERARQFLMVPDYLNFRLCGSLCNEASNASTTQMLSLATGDWDPALLALSGLGRDRLPRLVAPGTILAEAVRPGQIGHEVAVIAPATHDTASAVAAIPFEDEDEIFISSGTWSLMGFESRTAFADGRAQQLDFSNERGADGRFLVLKNRVGLWPVQQIALESGTGHGDLAEAAAAARPWASLIDPEDARFLNPPSMAAAIGDFCAETGQPVPRDPGSLARCVFESLALSYLSVRREIELLRGRPASRVRIVGGGSQNRLLNQLCADACQVPVLAGPTETSAIGNACLQFLALGRFGSLAEARERVRNSYPVASFRPAATVPESALARFQSFPPASLQGNPAT